MDLQTLINVLYDLLVWPGIAVGMVVLGGWLCWGGTLRSDDRGSGPQTALPQRRRADAVRAAGKPPAQGLMFNVRHEVILLYSCIALAGIFFVLLAPTDAAPAGSAVSPAAATEGTQRSTEAGTPAPRGDAAMQPRASVEYFPANYVNQSHGGDGNVMTYEHD